MKLSQIFGSAIGAFIAIVLFVVLISFYVVGAIANLAEESQKKPVIEKKSVLVINLDQPIKEKSSRNEWQGFNFDKLKPIHQLGLNELKLAINKAAQDDKIEANFVEAGLAVIHEIGLTLKEFQKSGKKVYAYGDAANERAFYLSTFADENYLNPSGYIEFNGIAVEVLYFNKMLKKLGIKPTLFRVGQYKSAMEPFIRNNMSEANRKQVETYINSIYDNILEDIGLNTGKEIDELREMSDKMLIKFPTDAKEHNLLTDLAYYDQVLEKLPVEETIELEDYLEIIADEETKKDKTIAVIVAEGPIVDGSGDKNEIGGRTLSETLRKVRKDEKIDAVVLRVNSPGGSALASDVIWREVKLLAQTKPVIASMSDFAASGGYYICMPASKIVANPQTITGSIGVFGLLINAENFLEDKLGITSDRVKTGSHADIGTPTHPISVEDSIIIQTGVDKIYETFIEKAAEGRKMTTDEVHIVAQGRVWSGNNALDVGLVDEVGTLEDAIKIAAKDAEINDFNVVYYPKNKNWLEKIFDVETAEKQYIKENLGSYEKYLDALKQAKNMTGIQTRLPYLLSIE